MYLSDISHQFNILLKQAKLDEVQTSASSQKPRPDDQVAEVVCQQLSRLEDQLKKKYFGFRGAIFPINNTYYL